MAEAASKLHTFVKRSSTQPDTCFVDGRFMHFNVQYHQISAEHKTSVCSQVASFIDRAGNHIEMGLHVFFGCYFNLFRLMRKTGAVQNLLLKEHTHTFCNADGDVRELDFRFDVNGVKIGAPFHGAYFICALLYPRYGQQAVAISLLFRDGWRPWTCSRLLRYGRV